MAGLKIYARREGLGAMTIHPLFASEKRAADLLDMPKSTFRDLVAGGVLPRPMVIGNCERWDVEALQRAIRGELETLDGVQW
jgi:hypothetical protein